LNEPEEDIAPTDSRLRPDQRLMEDGQWDEANAEKLRLEEKQRAARRAREHDTEKAAAQGRFLYRHVAKIELFCLWDLAFFRRITLRGLRTAVV
jgi:hypothetical protein